MRGFLCRFHFSFSCLFWSRIRYSENVIKHDGLLWKKHMVKNPNRLTWVYNMIYLTRKRCQWKLAWSSRPLSPGVSCRFWAEITKAWWSVSQRIVNHVCTAQTVFILASWIPKSTLNAFQQHSDSCVLFQATAAAWNKVFRVMCDSAGHDLQRCSLRVYSVSRWPQTSSVLVHARNQSQ